MIAGWTESPGRKGEGGGRRGVSGTLVVAVLLALAVLLWSGFTWLASSRYDDLHVVTFRSEWPGRARVQALRFGEREWSVAFKEHHDPLSAEERQEEAWLPRDFSSGPSLQRAEGGCTYRVQLRAAGADAQDAQDAQVAQATQAVHAVQAVDVEFAPGRQTHLRLDATGRLHVSSGRMSAPELSLFGWRSEPASERPRLVDAAALPPAPPAGDPMLPSANAGAR